MRYSTDVGSLPFPPGFDEERFLHSCELFERSRFQESRVYENSMDYFEKCVCDAFVDKICSGIDIPCYPQFRDMLEQFSGFYRIHEGYFTSMPERLLTDQGYDPRYTFVSEVEVLKKYSEHICESTGREKIELKICVTSPLDLSFQVPTDFLVSMAKNACLDTKYLKTRLVTLDIPSFGYQMVVDRTLDACHEFFRGVKATGRDVETSLHIHAGNHRDFLDMESLDILEIHSRLLESPPILRRELEDHDKYLQVGIADTASLAEPESMNSLRKRAKRATRLFKERVRYFSPDCALRGLPSYGAAIRLLRNVAKVTQELG